MYYISLLLVTVMILRGGGKCNCIVSIHLYSASCSAHQSEALPVRETQKQESRLELTKRGTWMVTWLTSSLESTSKLDVVETRISRLEGWLLRALREELQQMYMR